MDDEVKLDRLRAGEIRLEELHHGLESRVQQLQTLIRNIDEEHREKFKSLNRDIDSLKSSSAAASQVSYSSAGPASAVDSEASSVALLKSDLIGKKLGGDDRPTAALSHCDERKKDGDGTADQAPASLGESPSVEFFMTSKQLSDLETSLKEKFESDRMAKQQRAAAYKRKCLASATFASNSPAATKAAGDINKPISWPWPALQPGVPIQFGTFRPQETDFKIQHWGKVLSARNNGDVVISKDLGRSTSGDLAAEQWWFWDGPQQLLRNRKYPDKVRDEKVESTLKVLIRIQIRGMSLLPRKLKVCRIWDD